MEMAVVFPENHLISGFCRLSCQHFWQWSWFHVSYKIQFMILILKKFQGYSLNPFNLAQLLIACIRIWLFAAAFLWKIKIFFLSLMEITSSEFLGCGNCGGMVVFWNSNRSYLFPTSVIELWTSCWLWY